eukprot:10479788-Prorocentrum_lima.AAC.1
MTSSLVGSEMCIRDREVPHPVLKSLCGGTMMQRDVYKAPHECFGCSLQFCLLYTSDAADDM